MTSANHKETGPFRAALAVAALLAAAAPAFAQSVPSPAARLDAARALAARNLHAEAMREYDALATLPADETAAVADALLYHRAVSLLATGATRDARSCLEALLRDHPDTAFRAQALDRLGLACLLSATTRDECEAALAHFDAAIKAGPDGGLLEDVRCHRLAAEALLADLSDKLDDAASRYAELLSAHPDRIEPFRLPAARLFARAGRADDALALARHRPADGAQEDAWLLLLGSAELARDHPERAEPHFAALRRRFPESRLVPEAACGEARALRAQRKFDAARERALSVPEGDSRRADALWLVAECFADTPDPAGTVGACDRFAQAFPDDPRVADAAYLRASSLQSLSSWREASSAYRDFLARFPNHALAPKARFAAGHCLLQLGQADAALREWAELHRLSPGTPSDAEGLYRSALELVRQRRSDEALAALDALLALRLPEERTAEALYWRAFLRAHAGELARAEEDLRRIPSLKPRRELGREATFLLGVVLRREGKDGEAASVFQRLLDDPVRTWLSPNQLAWVAELQCVERRPAEADAAARRLLEQASTDDWRQIGWTLVGRAALLRDDHAAATVAFRNAVAIPVDSPFAAEAHLRLGEMLRGTVQDTPPAALNAALEHFTRAAELAPIAATPDSPARLDILVPAQMELARTLVRLNRREEAARLMLCTCLLYDDPALSPAFMREAIAFLQSLGRGREAEMLREELERRYPAP